MSVDDSYYPYKQPGSVPFNWEIRPGVPKHHRHLNPHSPLRPGPEPGPEPGPVTRPLSSLKLKPSPPASVSQLYPFEEPRTRSFISAPRTRSILSSSPRTHSQRIVSTTPRPGPELVGPGCFPSPSKQDRKSGGRGSKRISSVTGRSRRVESEFGFDFGPDYASDLEMLVRWSTAMRKSNAAFRNSSPDDDSSTPSSWSSDSPVSHAEWAALNLF